MAGTYDLSGATTSEWTYGVSSVSSVSSVSDECRRVWNSLREPGLREPPAIRRLKPRFQPRFQPRLRRTDGQSDCTTGVAAVAMSEEELEAGIRRLKLRSQRLADGLQRLRGQMRAELKPD